MPRVDVWRYSGLVEGDKIDKGRVGIPSRQALHLLCGWWIGGESCCLNSSDRVRSWREQEAPLDEFRVLWEWYIQEFLLWMCFGGVFELGRMWQVGLVICAFWFRICFIWPPTKWLKALASWNRERLCSDVLASVLMAVTKAGGYGSERVKGDAER